MSPRNLALLAPLLLALSATVGQAEIPEGYYAAAEGLDGRALRVAIHDTIVNHHVLPYSSRRAIDVREGVEAMDEDPNRPLFVNLLYSDAVAHKGTWPGYNREHTWPQSLGARTGTPAHTDLHHIFACDANVNSARGNKMFDDCDGDCRTHVEAPEAFYAGDSWEPPDEDKGDVARALLYLDVRYEGDIDGEPNLKLVDAGVEPGCDCMGRLKTLLEWHEEDPPDARERYRQEVAFKLQGNRNPFIDHPEWVELIWAGGEQVVLRGPVLMFDPWISAVHYDNRGRDRGEGVEITGPADLNLERWHLEFYDGRTQKRYRRIPLHGRIDAELKGVGARWFPVQRIQNGAADAIALVNPQGRVVEFLSYEGGHRPLNGVARGMDTEVIPVAESRRTPVGHSIKRGFYSDDLWQVGVASPGFVNADF